MEIDRPILTKSKEFFKMKSTVTKLQLTKAKQIMSSNSNCTKYHRASIDGYIDVLCDASKRDANQATEEGYTPTLLAAQYGHLEALRILVGRGGNPEKTNSAGLSGLHLAASRNHLNCVSFLVNFGVNMWALDNDLHTAKDVAAIEQRKEVLEYLDQMMARQSAFDTKNVQKLKDKAKMSLEKRLKQLRKDQLKAIKQVEKDERYLLKLSMSRRPLKAAHSISDIKLVGRGTENMIDYSPKPNAKDLRASSSSLLNNLGSNFKSISSKDRSSVFSESKTSSSKHTSAGYYRGKFDYDSAYSSSSLSISSRSNNAPSMLSGSTYGANSTSQTGSVVYSNRNQKDSEHRPKYSDLVAIPASHEFITGNCNYSNETDNNNNNNNNDDTVNHYDNDINKKIIMESKEEIQEKKSRKMNIVTAKLQLRQVSRNDISDNGNIRHVVETKRGKLKRLPPNDTNTGLLIRSHASVLDLSSKNKAITSEKLECEIKSSKLSSERISVDDANSTETNKMIKWPPAPNIARASSEPELESLAIESKPNDDSTNVGQTSEEGREVDANNELLESHIANPSEPKRESSEVIDPGKTSCDPKRKNVAESKHHLMLNQCLSQLKLHREQQQTKSNLVINSHLFSKDLVATKLFKELCYSNELLQHRQNAGDLPLKPSLIKQQQQQLASSRAIIDHKGIESSSSSSSRNITASRVDSIGSGSSYSQNNSTSTSISDSSKISSASSPRSSSSSSWSKISSYNSEYLSSSETVKCQKSGCFNHQFNHENGMSIEMFLSQNGLLDLSETFAKEKIDLEALLLLTEDDLKSIDILLGPRKKLLRAIESFRNNVSLMNASNCVIIDTDL